MVNKKLATTIDKDFPGLNPTVTTLEVGVEEEFKVKLNGESARIFTSGRRSSFD